MSEHRATGASPEDVRTEGTSPREAGHAPTEGDAAAAVHATPANPAPDKPLFSAADRAQFDADDVQAGSHIGKMLAIFFLYTVLAMSVVAWWTFRAIQ